MCCNAMPLCRVGRMRGTTGGWQSDVLESNRRALGLGPRAARDKIQDASFGLCFADVVRANALHVLVTRSHAVSLQGARQCMKCGGTSNNNEGGVEWQGYMVVRSCV